MSVIKNRYTTISTQNTQ